MRTRSCRNCGAPRVRARGLCSGCYEYRRRTGEDRPPEVVAVAGRRRLEEQQLGAMVRRIARRIAEGASR